MLADLLLAISVILLAVCTILQNRVNNSSYVISKTHENMLIRLLVDQAEAWKAIKQQQARLDIQTIQNQEDCEKYNSNKKAYDAHTQLLVAQQRDIINLKAFIQKHIA